jgi:hypothetical protein
MIRNPASATDIPLLDINRRSIFRYAYKVALLEDSMKLDGRLRRRLKLRDLDTFVTVVECGSMAKAATKLSVSQPAVSNAVAAMERTLGVP